MCNAWDGYDGERLSNTSGYVDAGLEQRKG